MKNVKVLGHKTCVSVETLTTRKTHTSFAVDGLKVRRISRSDAEWSNISKAYTNDHLPVDSSETATSEKIKKWKYLQEMDEEISHGDNTKVELLIGANCTTALEPVQVIANRGGGPYAMKTVLCINCINVYV